jgi:hypothetical protein
MSTTTGQLWWVSQLQAALPSESGHDYYVLWETKGEHGRGGGHYAGEKFIILMECSAAARKSVIKSPYSSLGKTAEPNGCSLVIGIVWLWIPRGWGIWAFIITVVMTTLK